METPYLDQIMSTARGRIGHPRGHRPIPDGMPAGSTAWTVTLRYGGRSESFAFYTGPAIRATPTAADLLDSLFSDATYVEDGPWEMAEEMGVSTAAEARKMVTETYPAIVANTAQLRRLLGNDYDAVRVEVEESER